MLACQNGQAALSVAFAAADYQTALGKPQKLEPASGAPKALMQLLYLLVQRLEYMSVCQHQDNVTQADLSWYKAQNGVSKSSLGKQVCTTH